MTTVPSDNATLADMLPPEGERRVTVNEAADLLGRPASTVRHWIDSKKLDAWRVLGRVLTTIEAIERAMSANGDGPVVAVEPARNTARRAAHRDRERRIEAMNAELDARGV